jgi:hypothetical protein
MVFVPGRFLVLAIALVLPVAGLAENEQQVVQQAVQTELTKARTDHSLWIYFDSDRQDDRAVEQWVADTSDGSLHRVVKLNGQPVVLADQWKKVQSFLQNSSAQARQRKSSQHDDQQAAELLNMLPQAFIWTREGKVGSWILLHFRPNPQFQPPDFEARVFAAMEGDMAVDNQQHRIASLKGRLIRDVKILGGLVASLYAGGTFDVERRQLAPGIWQITQTHVHIQGHALLFKTISEQEDDVKSDFKQLPPHTTMRQAVQELMAQHR